MFTGLASEENGALPFDGNHRPITELDSSSDLGVQLGEDVPRPCHVVHRAGVKHLAARSHSLLLLLAVEVEEDLAFVKVDLGLRIDSKRH
jgi:hypothetical protein